MAPYLAVALLCGVLASLAAVVGERLGSREQDGNRLSKERPNLNFFDVIAAATLVVFSALRFNVGTDYQTYATIFNNLNVSDLLSALQDSPQEVGFTLLMILVKAVSDSPYAIFSATACLTVVPIYYVLRRHSLNPALTITLYVLLAYVPSFNGIRQWVAVALLFFGWSCLGRKNAGFVVFACLAATMHISAVLAAIVMVVARQRRVSRNAVFIALAIALAVAAVIDRLPIVAQWFSTLNPRYENYFYSGETGLGSYLQIGAFMLLLLFSLYFGRREVPLSAQDHQYAIYVLVAISFMVIGTQAVIIGRMASYFTPFVLLLAPNRIAMMSDRALASLTVVIGSLAYYVMYLSNYGDLVPYSTWLSAN